MRRVTLFLLIAPLALAACGGGSSQQASGPQLSPVAYVKHAATKTEAMTSEHMTMAAKMAAGPMQFTMSGTGDFANTRKEGEMSLVMSVLGRSIRMDEVSSGTTIYVRSPMFGRQLPNGKTWAKLDLEKLGKSQGIDFSSLMSQSPTQGLQRLEAAGSVESLGTETVNGVETTHYRVTNLDISKLPQGAKVEALAHPKYGPIDVWIGNSNGYVYRESMSFTYSVSGQLASMSMTVNLSKFGEAVHVTVPPASETVDMASLAGSGIGG